MKSHKTPSFVAEFPLQTTPADESILRRRFEAGRQIYNACLGESLRILDLMRESKVWQLARKMSKGPARTALFKAITRRYHFKSGIIQKFAERCRDRCWIGDHLGSHDTQKISLRAFQAVEQYSYGNRGRPRFKGKNRLRSIEGKSNAAVIRYRDGAVYWDGLKLPLMFDPQDKDGWQAMALQAKTKYCRILFRNIRGKTRWCVQLIQEGYPPLKANRTIGEQVVGLDLGPSEIAGVSQTDAMLEKFCPSVVKPWKAIRRIQRAMDRSRRATNPQNYDNRGVPLKGRHIWKKSSRYRKLAGQCAGLERRLAAERRRAHGELCNRILGQGNIVKTEKLSYRAFQKMFGKSVGRSAPGKFIAELRRKAERAGGKLMEFLPGKTRLSQYDHTTGEYVKKPLGQRIHHFGDGITSPVQRDLYSAFLACFVESDVLDASQVKEAWPGAEPLLRRAASRHNQSAMGEGFPLPNARKCVRADRPSKRSVPSVEAADVVSFLPRESESRGEMDMETLRTPWL